MKKLLTSLALGVACCAPASAQWTADLGDGTYRNPIIHADYSDPDVIRVGDDYWMVASSFTHFPGIPILHSRDLVNWQIAGHVYDRLPLDKYDRPVHGEGSWAPALRYHDGMYYIYFCTPYDGLFVARATDPRGPWELTQMLEVAKWEDPCPFWDDNGDAYLVHSIHRGGPAVIHRMSDDGLRLLDNGTVVYNDQKTNPILEGMKMHKRDGWYYIFAPAGGVSTGWQTVLRSRSIYGPYEARRVMEQGSSPINGPHQGGLIDTPDGNEWWFIHFQGKGAYGRVIHLQPARWTSDGWIVIGDDPDGDGIGNPVLTHAKPHIPSASGVTPSGPQTSDEFSSTRQSLQWQWQAHPRDRWYSLTARPGYMRLYAETCPSEHGNLYFAGNLYLQKLPAPSFTATTCVETAFTTPGERAGLIVMGNEYSYIAVINDTSGRRISVVTGKNDKYAVKPKERASAAIPADVSQQAPVWLRVQLIDDHTCRYAYSLDGNNFTPLGPDCPVVAGTWVGAKTGIFCSSPNVVPSDGYADFDYFHIE